MIYALCFAYACFLLTNPLKASTSNQTSTESNTISTGTVVSSADLGNGFKVEGQYDTKITN